MTSRGRHAPAQPTTAARQAPAVAPPAASEPICLGLRCIAFTDAELKILRERLNDYPCPYGKEYGDWTSAVRKIVAEARRRGC